MGKYSNQTLSGTPTLLSLISRSLLFSLSPLHSLGFLSKATVETWVQVSCCGWEAFFWHQYKFVDRSNADNFDAEVDSVCVSTL